LNPSIVAACGAVAAEALFLIKQPKMSQIAGRIIDISVPVLQDKICYVMYHPAYVLHQRQGGQEVYTKARKALWEQILTLKELMYGRAI
jgi:uracil-DNA glycosylase